MREVREAMLCGNGARADSTSRGRRAELPARPDEGMAGEEPLGECRAGAKHAADEDEARILRRRATASRRRPPGRGVRAGNRRDQRVDEALVRASVVVRRWSGARAARAVGRRGRSERLG